ncbi:MAG: hypothetical protein M3394_02960 [Actinomycetota bacterium]|nr:hypothetical protein [Actinomycetota bacterium]
MELTYGSETLLVHAEATPFTIGRAGDMRVPNRRAHAIIADIIHDGTFWLRNRGRGDLVTLADGTHSILKAGSRIPLWASRTEVQFYLGGSRDMFCLVMAEPGIPPVEAIYESSGTPTYSPTVRERLALTALASYLLQDPTGPALVPTYTEAAALAQMSTGNFTKAIDRARAKLMELGVSGLVGEGMGLRLAQLAVSMGLVRRGDLENLPTPRARR